jgi:hypothetical protein
VEVEPIELDRRRVCQVSVDVTGSASADQVDRRVIKALDLAGAGEMDFAAVRLAGRLGPGVRWSGPGAELRARVFHARTDASAVRPDHDLAAYRASGGLTTEERFALELITRLDAETDPGKRAVIEQALHYGLDAFRLREVTPAFDEVSA